MLQEYNETEHETVNNDSIRITCPSCSHSGMTDVYEEIGKLRGVCFFIIKSMFTGDGGFNKDRLPYGFEKNHYCKKCGCYIGCYDKKRELIRNGA